MLARARIESVDLAIVGHWAYVLLRSDQGALGVGEATYFTHPLALRSILDDLREVYVGADPYRPEFLYQSILKKHCMIDAASSALMSAVDQALWDLKARQLDVPVWELLGGRVRDRVRAILLVEALDEQSMIEGAKKAVSDGFTAIKIKPFMEDWQLLSSARLLRVIRERIAAVREVIGWDVDLAVEVHRNLPPALAVELAEQTRSLHLYFIEDPVQPFSVSVNRAVAEQMPVTVALAERNSNIWEFREYSDGAGVTILRPDAGLAGGFTQMRKIAAIAESRHQRILPHNFTSPVLTAVHVQCAAAIHNWDLQGYIREDRAPWNQVVQSVNRVENGFLCIPESPGIGIVVDEARLREGQYEPFGSRFNHQAFLGRDGAVKLQ